MVTMPPCAHVTPARVASSFATAWCSSPSASTSDGLVYISQGRAPSFYFHSSIVNYIFIFYKGWCVMLHQVITKFVLYDHSFNLIYFDNI